MDIRETLLKAQAMGFCISLQHVCLDLGVIWGSSNLKTALNILKATFLKVKRRLDPQAKHFKGKAPFF